MKRKNNSWTGENLEKDDCEREVEWVGEARLLGLEEMEFSGYCSRSSSKCKGTSCVQNFQTNAV